MPRHLAPLLVLAVVVLEAHDKVHGVGGRTVTVDLGRPSGPGFTVTRRD